MTLILEGLFTKYAGFSDEIINNMIIEIFTDEKKFKVTKE